MIKFKKGYNVKIIALFVAVSFFLNSTVYGIELCKNSNLRSPLMAGKSRLVDAKERLASGHRINRRSFLKAGAVALGILALPVPIDRSIVPVDPVSMVKRFLAEGSNIIIFGDSHERWGNKIILTNIINSLKEKEIDYLALEMHPHLQSDLDTMLLKLDRNHNGALTAKIHSKLVEWLLSELNPDTTWDLGLEEVIPLVDLIISAHAKGIKVVCIDPRENECRNNDIKSPAKIKMGRKGLFSVEGKTMTVDEAMAENILKLKGRGFVLIGQKHAMNNYVMDYYMEYGKGAKSRSLASIIKKRVPSAKIVLGCPTDSIPDKERWINNLTSISRLTGPIAIDDLSQPEISGMTSPYYFGLERKLGESGDALIIWPSEKLEGFSLSEDELSRYSTNKVSLFIAEKMEKFRIVTLGRSHFNNYADEYAAKAIDDFIKRNPGKTLIVGIEMPLTYQKYIEDYIKNGITNESVSFVIEQYEALLQTLRGHYLNGVYVQVVCYDAREFSPMQAFEHDDKMARVLIPLIEKQPDAHILLTGGSKHLGLFKQIKKNIASPSLAWILSNKFKGQIYTMDMQAPSVDLVLRHKDGITTSTVIVPQNDLISYLWRTHHFSDMAMEVKNPIFGNIRTINNKFKEIYANFTGLELDDIDYILGEVWDGIVYISSKRFENRGSLPALGADKDIRANI